MQYKWRLSDGEEKPQIVFNTILYQKIALYLITKIKLSNTLIWYYPQMKVYESNNVSFHLDFVHKIRISCCSHLV